MTATSLINFWRVRQRTKGNKKACERHSQTNQKKAQEAEELLTFGGTAPSLDPNDPLDAALANLAGTLKGPRVTQSEASPT